MAFQASRFRQMVARKGRRGDRSAEYPRSMALPEYFLSPRRAVFPIASTWQSYRTIDSPNLSAISGSKLKIWRWRLSVDDFAPLVDRVGDRPSRWTSGSRTNLMIGLVRMPKDDDRAPRATFAADNSQIIRTRFDFSRYHLPHLWPPVWRFSSPPRRPSESTRGTPWPPRKK